MNISPRWAYWAVLLAVFGHASSEFFAVLTALPGAVVSVWRFILGGIGLIILALLFSESRNLLEPFKRSAFQLLRLSLIGVTGAYLAFHMALDYASVIQVATLVTTIPIFVGIANLVINKQPFTKVKRLTGVCAVTAIALLITEGALGSLLKGDRSILGILLALCCAALIGYYAIAIKPLIAEYGGLRITALSTMIGGIGLYLCVTVLLGIPLDTGAVFYDDTIVWVALLILAFWNTTVTQYLWIGGLAAAPDITKASYLFFLKPVIAALLAVIFLGEHLTPARSLRAPSGSGTRFWMRWMGLQNLLEWPGTGFCPSTV
ncbi:MAG: DMT family transporter, partial [Pseudomonadota bacterium]